MASIKISGLTEQTTASDTDLLPVASSTGTAKRMTLANFVTWLASKLNSKFAPAGYGLGGDTMYLSSNHNLDDITQCGFYSYAHNSVPTNGVTITDPFQYVYHLTVSRDANGTIVQSIKTCGAGSNDANYHIGRVKGFGGWSPWEYDNPPMEPGVEYRTTERWLSKPVYTKLVDCGPAPNATTRSVYVTDKTATALVRWSGYASYSGVSLPTTISGWESGVAWNSEGFQFTITTNTDRSACNVTVQVWYTKS